MILGIFLLTTNASLSFKIGDLLLLLGGFLIGFDHAFSKKIIKSQVAPDVLTPLRTIIGSLVLLFFTMLTSSFSFNHLGIYLVSGLLIFVSVLLRNIGLKNIKTGIVSSILLTSPIFTVLIGILFLDESLSLAQIIGGIIVLLGGYKLTKT